MIEVLIRTYDDDQSPIQLGRIVIKKNYVGRDGTADYSVKFMVERGSAVGLHKRLMWGFPRKQLNVLALVRQALNTLDPKELELERGFDPDSPEANRTSDMARRLKRIGRKVQRGES